MFLNSKENFIIHLKSPTSCYQLIKLITLTQVQMFTQTEIASMASLQTCCLWSSPQNLVEGSGPEAWPATL